jgi:LPS-assembly protein
MLKFIKRVISGVVVLMTMPSGVTAQTMEIPGVDDIVAGVQEQLTANLLKATVGVELTLGTMKFYADQVEYHRDTDRLVASGNVLLTDVDHIIAADRAEFIVKTRLGTFYNARGFATVGASGPGSRPPPPPNPFLSPALSPTSGPAEPDVQFYGDILEKTGPDSYLITRGGFTTCAQPNPRWQMTSSSLKLRVDHYALLRNMQLKVKGVPALYLPAMYYPLSKDNRSTGFLMPSYGSSTIKGQTISNAFFWAINRSQDATVLHDWFSKTGQAVAGEYRYVSLLGSGNFRTEFLNEHPTTYVSEIDQSETVQPGRQSFRLNGNLSQGLGRGWYAQGRADYSSDLLVDQLYSTDINRASQRNRIFGGSVTGSITGLRVTGTYDRNEYFYSAGNSSLRGNSPRVNVSRPDRVLGKIPVYASVGAEYLHLIAQGFDADHVRDRKDDIDRLDIVPVLRFPYTKLPFLSLNTSLTWRNTFWSNSFPLLEDGRVGPRSTSPISRRFLEMTADVNGPTLVRIWDAPDTRFKHSIEPFMQVTHRTGIDNFDQIIKSEGSDYIVGKATSYSYGVNTRFYSKRTADGPSAIPRELIGATIRQTYNTDARWIHSDQQDRSNSVIPVSHFTPVSMLVRTSPTTGVTGTFRSDFDGRYSKFKNFGADGSWEHENVSLLAGWSQVRFQPDREGKNIATPSHFYNSNATVRFKKNRFGVVHNFNWDIQNKSVLQQRISGYYNAQCCGFSAEYQMFDLSRLGALSPVLQDSRFHFSVTLGGIGNVSNIFGALAGTPNR